MDGSDITRRDTFKLARFGLLLAAGIGVVERSEAGEPDQHMWKLNDTMLKVDFNSIIVKLYQPTAGGGFTLLRASTLPAVQAKTILDGTATQFMVKWTRNGQLIGSLNDTMQKI